MDDTTSPLIDGHMKIIIILLFIGIMFECGLILYSYINADKVECNWLWCTFTTQKSNYTEECYTNGMQVNCSEIRGVDWDSLDMIQR